MTSPERKRPSTSAPERERKTAKKDWGAEKRRLSVMIGVRFTPEEADRLRAFAKTKNLSVPELLRVAWTFMEAVSE